MLNLTPKAEENQGQEEFGMRFAYPNRPMNMNLILIVFFFLLNTGLSSGEVLPRIFRESQEFILVPTDGQGETRTLVESQPFGDPNLAVLSLSPGNYRFMMQPPLLDSCGFIHFGGNSVVVVDFPEKDGNQYRFYEIPIRGDVFCEPRPFPRCGAPKTTPHQRVTPYLKEMLTHNEAACYLKIWDGDNLIQTYQIQAGRSLRNAQF